MTWSIRTPLPTSSFKVAGLVSRRRGGCDRRGEGLPEGAWTPAANEYDMAQQQQNGSRSLLGRPSLGPFWTYHLRLLSWRRSVVGMGLVPTGIAVSANLGDVAEGLAAVGALIAVE